MCSDYKSFTFGFLTQSPEAKSASKMLLPNMVQILRFFSHSTSSFFFPQFSFQAIINGKESLSPDTLGSNICL